MQVSNSPNHRDYASNNATLRTGRYNNQMRPVVVELGPVAHASGSAYIQFGDTKVICSVHGPRPSTKSGVVFSDLGQIECEVKFAGIARSSVAPGLTDCTAAEKLMASLILDSLQPAVRLEKYPKAVISIHIIVLQGCGGELATAITCGSLALADAAVELLDMVTACTTMSSSEVILVDPDQKEISASTSSLTLAKMSSLGTFTQVRSLGRMEPSTFKAMMQMTSSGCDSLRNIITSCIREKIEKGENVVNK